MALYLLDTDISSYLIRKRPVAVLARMDAVPLSQQVISVVTYAEIMFGLHRNPSVNNERAAALFFGTVGAVLDWNRAAADAYAVLRSTLESMGRPIGSMDTLIAAHALSLGAILVTNNVRHFNHVPNLEIENWAA